MEIFNNVLFKLVLYWYYCSVVLVVDNFEFYNKFVVCLKGSIDIKFVVVFWGFKDSLESIKNESDVLFYFYEEFMIFGRISR